MGFLEGEDDGVDGFVGGLLVGVDGEMVVEVSGVAQFVASAGETLGPAFGGAVGSGRFAAFQFGEGAKDADGEEVGGCFTESGEEFGGPDFFLEEVVDDQVGAELEMGGPALVEAAEEASGEGAEGESEAGASAVLSFGEAVVEVFPACAAVVRGAGGELGDVAAFEADEADGLEFVGHEEGDVIEGHAGEGLVGDAVGEVGETILEGAAEGGFS